MKDIYDSPIEFITEQMATNIAEEFDGQVVKAVQKYYIDVDNDKLAEILTADKKRYDEAYRRGMADSRAHGKWIEDEYFPQMTCSECGMVWGDVNRKADFCPNCGAMMSGVD